MDYNNEKKNLIKKTFGPALFNAETSQKLKVEYVNNNVIISITKIDSNFKDVEGSEVSVQFTSNSASNILDTLLSCYDSYRKGEPFNEMVELGFKVMNGFQVFDGSMTDNEYGFYVAIHKNINETGTPEMSGFFQTETASKIQGYNFKTGSGKKIKKTEKGVTDIIRIFEELVKASTKGLAHVIADSGKWHNNFVSEALKTVQSLTGGSSSSSVPASQSQRSSFDIFNDADVTLF
jgi:hypothetical protein